MKSASRKPQPKRKYFKSRGFSRLFCFSWEQRKFEDLYDYASEGGTPDTNNPAFYEGGKIPFVKIEDTVEKYIDSPKSYITEEGMNHSSAWLIPKGNVIFTNGATVGNVAINRLPVTTKQGILGIIPSKKVTSEFLFYLLSSTEFQREVRSRMATGTFATIILKSLNEIPVCFPSNTNEQESIITILSRLDNLITLHQRDSIMRFFGAWDNANAWEQRKFGDIVETRRGLTYKPSDICDSGIRVLRSSNIDEDTFVLKADDVFVKKDAVNIDYAKENDILITSANGSSRLVGKHAIISSISGYPAVHGGFMLLGTTKEPYFINASMGSSWYRRFIELYVAGGNGAIGNLNKNDLDNQVISIPSEPEQRAIGAFFKQLDHLITLHQRDSIMRFFGAWDNANAWEQRKFGDIVETRRGLTYKPSDICDSGIRVLRSSNIDEDTFVLKADDVFVKKDAVNIDYAKENDILITSANGSSRLVGKHAIISSISGYPAVHGGFMLLGTTKEPYFINASMGSSWYRRFIELYVAGGNGAIGNLNKNDLDNQVISIPSEPEQRAIGAFFKQLDHLITLHQRKGKAAVFRLLS